MFYTKALSYLLGAFAIYKLYVNYIFGCDYYHNKCKIDGMFIYCDSFHKNDNEFILIFRQIRGEESE